MKESVDVIMHTRTSNEAVYSMTKIALMMLFDSEKDYNFKVHLYETDPNSNYDYTGLCYNYFRSYEPYNCCKLINEANSVVSHDWILIVNNDLRFERGWFSKIVDVYKQRPDIESFSPKDPLIYSKYYDYHFVGTDEDYCEAYTVTEFMAGWCYVMRKRVWDAVYPWDEQFQFYFADNDYVQKIKKAGIKHALVRDSLVFHFGSQTIGEKIQSERFIQDESKFRKKWNLWE